ncbi:PREDICTED: coiled-coil and C2 domain-containing protein 1-like isoform X2 [Papilio polytes]|uniref:coiled-coil and C2 domain-containing protein 1-like isoform X2 n=1 Tax=Papilio polytes TaxID=76194 RepID=UPI0006764C65|nr:PREDICTED: coiled-coil and C2 domain-containing protein 1-like isoform X2 [Papilio polytes]
MSRKPSSGKKSNLSQFGLLDIPDFDDGDEPLDLSDDDIDLEAELAAISGGGARRPKKPAPVPVTNLDAMIAESLKDIPSDDEGSGDDDDPDLLSELKELAIDDDEAPPPPPRAARPAPPPPGSTDSSVISVLQDRITNYSAAEKHAKDSGESSRARRFGRGLKTLNDLLKQAKAGRPIKNEDIPPPVTLGKSAPEQPAAEPIPSAPPRTVPAPEAEELPIAPEPMEPPPPPPRVESQGISSERQEGLQIILRRKEEFKAAALSCKHSGDKALALEHLKVVKQFELVVDAYKAGQEMDLSELPTPEAIAAAFKSQQKGEESVQNSTEASPLEPTPEPAGLITASTLAEALKQRLAAFQDQEAKAKEQGNSSKARRMGRIVKQYQDAIRLHAAGRPLPVDELPTPSGYAPLPTEQGSGHASPAAPRAPPRAAPAPASPHPSTAPSTSPSTSPSTATSRHDRQLTFLLHKQKEFKEAALNAKREGNISQAKEYLRAAKGFDSVIEAARGGLLVDLTSLPLPPREKKQIEQTFDIVSKEDCDELETDAEEEDVLSRLQRQLTAQLQQCLRHKEHCRALGHLADMHRFEQLANTVKQDLDVVVVAKSLGHDPPKFHYENKVFSVVQCNTDLNENELELSIVRGIAYNVPNPKEIDTYVKFDFPYPQEAPVSDRTGTVKDTNSPQYEAVFTLPIQRNNRQCLRVFKRHAIKFEVYSRGGWFSRDALLATAALKLAPLETQVTLNEAIPLMEGRRAAGGSLEVKLRVRSPLLQQQVDKTSHRWLVIDS